VHIIGVEYIMEPGYLMHHMAVYWGTQYTFPKCHSKVGPSSKLHGWARGMSRNVILPTDVGILLADESELGGKGIGIPPKSFRLEAHFENTKRLRNFQESFAVRLYYTTKLRKHTGAYLELADPKVNLFRQPVGDGLRVHTFSCPSSCTESQLPPHGVTVLFTLMHMHKAGLTAEVVHKRNVKEMSKSAVEHFDAGSGTKRVTGRYQLLPGDSYETRCTYQGNPSLSLGMIKIARCASLGSFTILPH
jgi:hypothetical protein